MNTNDFQLDEFGNVQLVEGMDLLNEELFCLITKEVQERLRELAEEFSKTGANRHPFGKPWRY